MCMICVDLAKGKITTEEAWNNLQEIIDSIPDHVLEVSIAIWNKEADEFEEEEEE